MSSKRILYQNQPWYTKLYLILRYDVRIPYRTLRLWLSQRKDSDPEWRLDLRSCWSIAIGLSQGDKNHLYTWDEMKERLHPISGSGKKIVVAPADKIVKLDVYVKEILACCEKARIELGLRGFNNTPFTSNLSSIGDFAPTDITKRDEYYSLVEGYLGLTLTRSNSLIVDVAKRMMN